MSTIKISQYIDASPEKVWKLWADLGGIGTFHPYVTNAYYISENREGKGAARVCEFRQGFAVEERAFQWNDGKSLSLKIDFIKGTKPPIDNIVAHVGVDAEGNGSRAWMEMHYEPKFGPIGAIMDKLMIRRQYEKLLPSILTGMKHYAETGEAVDWHVYQRILTTAPSPA